MSICFISGCPVIIELNQADAGFGGGFFVERSNVAVQHGTGNIEPACKLLHSLIRGEKNLQNLPSLLVREKQSQNCSKCVGVL